MQTVQTSEPNSYVLIAIAFLPVSNYRPITLLKRIHKKELWSVFKHYVPT